VKQSGDHHHQTATIGSSVQNDDVHDGFADWGDDLDEWADGSLGLKEPQAYFGII
jgi:hypothetical protein